DPNLPGHLQSSLVNDLALDKNGDVWVATTSGGVSKYNRQTKDFKTFTMQDGLPENSITAIASDHTGNLWLSSFKGLTSMTPTGRVITHYDKHNGMRFTGFNSPMSVNDDGEILTGIANGFLKFHPDSLTVTTADFPIVITSVRQENRILGNQHRRTFNHRENDFTFGFSALTYTLPRQVKYAYRLVGYDKDWNHAGNAGTAKYTNLPEGRYAFEVKATDYSGRASMNTASFGFIIQPPFWKRWWFMALIAGALILSLGLWIRNLLRQIRSQAILNQFATSLYNQHTIREVFWTVAKNCVQLLNFEDCVMYLVQEDKDILVQKAAAGPKSTEPFRIHNPIEIPVGKGIVGTVAQTGKPEIIYNTARDKRYIIDDQRRLSELAVPIWVDGRVFGVIDTEHRRKNFYNRWHLAMLEKVAAICSVKISRYFVEEQIRSKVARDLHDEMGSTLSSIRIMSNIALQKKEAALSETYLAAIQQNASQMQESMSDIVWAINPENDSMESIVVRMKEFCAEMLEPLDIEYEFTEEGNFQEARLDLNARKDFYLIFKEALNNAAKYSGCKKVSVHLKHGETFNELRLVDNGSGFETGIEQQGNGLKNMRYRAKNISAELTIRSSPGEGTEITLRIPSHHHGI
ncbi:MAG TPA: triple tyrosine motif-containing protein, partial [Ohtaekwangia sp.]|nr:triple tyrosine motif-containing protein [Ohtaekwangia sp.]